MVGWAASHRRVIIRSSFGRRVVEENSARGRHRGEEEEAGGGGVCKQLCVAGTSHHPSLVKPSDARGIDGSFQGFDGGFEAKGVEIAGRTRAAGTGA